MISANTARAARQVSASNNCLRASDGAAFLAVIEETPAGIWCAIAVTQSEGSHETGARIQGAMELFSTFERAGDWVDKVAAGRGFNRPKVKVVRNAEKRAA